MGIPAAPSKKQQQAVQGFAGISYIAGQLTLSFI